MTQLFRLLGITYMALTAATVLAGYRPEWLLERTALDVVTIPIMLVPGALLILCAELLCRNR